MNDVFERFLQADSAGRAALIQDSDAAEVLQQRLGARGFEQFTQLAERYRQSQAEHIAAGDPPNLIFVPGIMGSLLKPTIGAGIWWIDAARTVKKIDSLGLNSSGTGPTDPKLEVVPCALDPSYEGFLLNAYDFRGYTVVQHPYDWRKSLLHSTEDLAKKIEETWANNGNKPVHLVAHSMGGLLIRTTLMLHGERLKSRLGRIVFIATPHYGSNCIAYYLREHIRGTWAMWGIGRYLSRTTFRSLWGVFNLLPAPSGIYPGTRDGAEHPCVNFDCYDAAQWRLKMTAVELSNFQNALTAAKELHERLFEFHQRMPSELLDSMAVIAGVGHEMPFRVEVLDGRLYGTRTEVDFDRRPNDPHGESDGSVSVASAALEGVSRHTRYVVGPHASLPNQREVYQDVFRFLNQEPMQLSTSAAGALSGHLSTTATPSEIGFVDQSASTDPHHDLGNRWRIPEPTPDEWTTIQADIENGRMPQFDRARIL